MLDMRQGGDISTAGPFVVESRRQVINTEQTHLNEQLGEFSDKLSVNVNWLQTKKR